MRKMYLLMSVLLSFYTLQAQRSPVAVNDIATMGQSRTITISVLANDSNFVPTDTICIAGVWGGAGWASVQTCSKVNYHPTVPTFVGRDTFYYRACDLQQPMLCDTGRVIVTINYLPPYHVNDTVTVRAGDTIKVNVLANDTNFNPIDPVRISNIFGGTAGWSWTPDSTQIIFKSTDSLYYGLQRIRYRSCDTRVSGLCDTGTLVVNVIRTPKTSADTVTLVQPATAVFSVTGNDSIFNALDSTCITQVWGQNASWASITSCGQISFHSPTYDFFGQDTLYYRSCYAHNPSFCDTGMLVLSIILPKPQVDFSYNESPPCHVQAINNSSLTDSVVWSVIFLTHNGNDFTRDGVNNISIAANQDSDFQVTVCLRAFNAAGDTTTCYTFWIQCQLNVGLAALKQHAIGVYPNPTAGRFTVNLATNQRSPYIVTDLSGRQIIGGLTTGQETELSISDLSSGIYILQIGDKDKSIYRIIKE